MNKFVDYQINKYADLPDNLKYETLDYEEVERRQRYAALDRKRKLKRNIILWSLAITISVIYSLCVFVIVLMIF